MEEDVCYDDKTETMTVPPWTTIFEFDDDYGMRRHRISWQSDAMMLILHIDGVMSE